MLSSLVWLLIYESYHMMETCISWWYNARISFINHKLIDAWYDLFAYLLEDEQRLSLGELIRAFCIIIIASYRSSLHCYLYWSFVIYAFLDDFWDFHTKSPLFVFNFWEAENLLFHILMFQGPFGTQKGRRFLQCQYFCTRSIWSTRNTRGGPRGPNETWWRDPHPRPRHLGLFPRWVSPCVHLFMHDSVSEENPMPYFS
jgi:hypothetical protein